MYFREELGMSGLRSQQLDEKQEDRCETGKVRLNDYTLEGVKEKAERSRITPKTFFCFVFANYLSVQFQSLSHV